MPFLSLNPVNFRNLKNETIDLLAKPEVIKAQVVLLAMGFLRPEQPQLESNVFVAGDAASGASLVVRAMASGRDAAQKVDVYLRAKE